MSMILSGDATEICKIEKAKRYTFQTSYNEYKKEVRNPHSWDIYSGVLSDFLYEINRAIIVDRYEWKIPFFGGFLRISKRERKVKEGEEIKHWYYQNKEGKWVKPWFYWKWDKRRNIMHWPKAYMWSFKAVEGRTKRRKYRAKAEDIGEYGLWNYIEKTRNDRYIPNYDVIIKKRSGRSVPFKDFVDSL